MIMFFAEVMFPPFDREVWVNTINYCDEQLPDNDNYTLSYIQVGRQETYV